MKRRFPLPAAVLMVICLPAAAHADVIASPFDRVTSTAHSAAPWLLVIALVGFTMLLLWRLRKKK